VEDKNPRRFSIFALVVLVRSCIGLIWASAGPLLPLLMTAFGISRGTASWFASAAPITIAAVSLPFAIFGSRYSIKKTFAIGAFLQSGGLLVLFFHSYPMIIITRILFAVGTAITVPVATAIAFEWFSSRQLPMLNGIQMSFVNLANAVACVATVPIATVLSWRMPIVIYGAYAITCALAWVVFGKEHPTPRVKPGTAQAAPKHELSLRKALTQRSTILLALAVMGSWCLGNALGSWLPTYYHQVFNMPLEKASSILAIITVGGTTACIVGGILTVRVGKRRIFIILPGIFMGFTAIAAVLFNNMLVIYASVTLFGVFSNLQTPSLFSIPMELPETSMKSGVAIMSVMQCGGNLGNFFGPLLVGYLADITGSYLPGFFIAAALSLSLLAAGLLLPETGPKAMVSSRKTTPAISD
jgi:MFS family permease